jgi:hypothetical protein
MKRSFVPIKGIGTEHGSGGRWRQGDAKAASRCLCDKMTEMALRADPRLHAAIVAQGHIVVGGRQLAVGSGQMGCWRVIA